MMGCFLKVRKSIKIITSFAKLIQIGTVKNLKELLMNIFISRWLSLSILLCAANSYGETLRYGALILEKQGNSVIVADPIVLKKGPHQYQWADMRNPGLYRDQDLYHSMADRKFWRGGFSRKGYVEEKKRKTILANNNIHFLFSVEELSKMFDPSCVSKVIPEIEKVKETFNKNNQIPSAVIVFRSEGGPATKYETSKDRMVASVHLDCATTKVKEVPQSQKTNVVDGDRSVPRGEVKPASQSVKKPAGANGL
jgi:hypothetical protein